jgi:hypothetical protein
MVNAELEAVCKYGLQHVCKLAGGKPCGGQVRRIYFGIEVEEIRVPGQGFADDGFLREMVCNHDERKQRSIDEMTVVDVATLLPSPGSVPMSLDRNDGER